MNGGMWKLSDQRGKVVLVNFWATWCGPCREEIPDLGRIARRFRGTDFELVGIAMDESGRKVVKDFVERSGIEYKVLLPSREEIGASGVDSLPTTYLVDRKGRVAKVLVGLADAREITENIQQLLAEQ
jgi:thiol-disulfide isomerase/thioredoxin